MIEGTNSNIITLYHGSETGLIGEIDVAYSKNVCDFGRGFYLGTDIMQAKNRVCNSSTPIIYTYELNLKDRDVYYFEDQVLWALYIARNRGKIDFSGSRKLSELFDRIDNHEIIAGLIADDKMAGVFNGFINGTYSSAVLCESLKLVKYGSQYVLKQATVCKPPILTEKSVVTLGKNDKAEALEWGKKAKKNMNSDLEKINIQYRREGKFIDEIIEEYSI